MKYILPVLLLFLACSVVEPALPEEPYLAAKYSVEVPPCTVDIYNQPIENPYILAYFHIRKSGDRILYTGLEVITKSIQGTGGGVGYTIELQTPTTGYVELQDARYYVTINWATPAITYTGREKY